MNMYKLYPAGADVYLNDSYMSKYTQEFLTTKELCFNIKNECFIENGFLIFRAWLGDNLIRCINDYFVSEELKNKFIDSSILNESDFLPVCYAWNSDHDTEISNIPTMYYFNPNEQSIFVKDGYLYINKTVLDIIKSLDCYLLRIEEEK